MKENENKVTCSICGAVLDPDDTHEFDGQYYCQDCLDDVTFVCDECGSRAYRDTGYSDNVRQICGPCYDDYYTYCERCDTLILNAEAYYHHPTYLLYSQLQNPLLNLFLYAFYHIAFSF